jgi:Ti-type conjugative transfer relaxase TraA
MAIYHFSGTIISRSQGRSAVACAAYRSAERLHDEKYDKDHDYTKKQDVAHTEILLPTSAPAWMSNREKLWNTVEAAEKRKDAQLAREFNFSLPRELTLEQNITLAREFTQQAFVSKGMVADLCIHNDKMPDGQLQPHAHIMLTLREVTPEGFGQKVREWNAKENLLQWREAWAEVANRHLFLHGYDQRIDHRTLDAQDIDLEPQHKIGAVVAQERLARLEDHQRIARENGAKLLEDPAIALHAITRQQSTFTHQDLARFVNRHTVDAEQFQTVYDKIKSHEQIVSLGHDAKGRERFTTQDLLAIETAMVQRAEQLTTQNNHPVTKAHQLQALGTRALSPEQQTAFAHLVSDGDLKNVIGYAGSGKSYLLGAAKDAWEAQGYHVQGVALSGIAAENLEAGSGIESRTMASRCYYWDKGEQLLTRNDILVVDEAGMIGSRQLNRLLEEAECQKAKVVLVGDPYQLQAIEAGAAFRAISERSPTVTLTDIRRQSLAWQQQATVELATGKTSAAIERYASHDHIHAFGTQAAAKQGLVALWNDVRLNEPDTTQIMLTYVREDVRELNQLARRWRREQGELGTDVSLNTERGKRDFAVQDRVYFLKNDRDLGVKNGTLGTVQRIQDNLLVVQLDKTDSQAEKARTVTFSTDRYHHLDHGYAATIHKSQGVTVDRSYVLASKYMDGHATYVGLSRHRNSVDVFYGRDEFANERALSQSLGRERSKDVTLDYRHDFAQQRGFEKAVQAKELQQTHSLSSSQTSFEHRIDHYDRVMQQAANKYYDGATHQKTSSRGDFKAFKAQFEAQNPEQARALQDTVRPRHERIALEAEKHIHLLEKSVAQSRMPRTAREQLEKYAAGIAKQPTVMAYLKQHNPEMTQKIEGLAKSHTLNRDRGGRSL